MRCNRPLRYKSRKVCSILILTHEYNVLCAFYIDISIILYKALKLALSQIKVFCKISTQFYTKLLLEIDAETSCLHFYCHQNPRPYLSENRHYKTWFRNVKIPLFLFCKHCAYSWLKIFHQKLDMSDLYTFLNRIALSLFSFLEPFGLVIQVCTVALVLTERNWQFGFRFKLASVQIKIRNFTYNTHLCQNQSYSHRQNCIPSNIVFL